MTKRSRGIRIHSEGRLLLIEAKSRDGIKLTYVGIGKKCNRNEKTIRNFFNGLTVDKESALSICEFLKVDINDVIDNPKDNSLSSLYEIKVELSEDILNKLLGSISFLEDMIPSATHKRVYEEWLNHSEGKRMKLKYMWNPAHNPKDAVALLTHWKANTVSLAHYLENLHIVVSYLKALEQQNLKLQKIRNILDKD